MDLLEPQNLPFAAALCIMGVLALIQVLGISDLLHDHDIHHGTADGSMDGLLSLLGIGRIPFMIWLALFLLLFAGLGLGIQGLTQNLTGGALDALLAAALAGIGALPAAGALSRLLGAVMPGDETTAITLDELLGRRAQITDGVARHRSPARARVMDRHGMAHHVMVEPHERTSELHAGDEVLLVRREGEAFYATALTERQLSPN